MFTGAVAGTVKQEIITRIYTSGVKDKDLEQHNAVKNFTGGSGVLDHRPSCVTV